MVFVVRDRKLGQQRIAMVAVVVHRIAPVGVLRPDSVSQKLVVRHLRKVGQTAGVPVVCAQHFLQEHQVRRHVAHGLAQLMQHEAPVEGGEAFVHIHGEHLERNRQGGWGGHG